MFKTLITITGADLYSQHSSQRLRATKEHHKSKVKGKTNFYRISGLMCQANSST